MSIKYIHLPEVHNLISPQIIVPKLIEAFRPQSVIDIGCGLGSFLYVFQKLGVNDILGIDGDWVDQSKLYIDPEFFLTANLEEEIVINRKFDLVLCLEVVEHISPKSADTIVKSLTNLGDLIIFSAATLNQGGQNHLNEQPPSYWIDIFSKYNYSFYDIFRKRFWNEKEIDWWYKQNMYLVVNNSIDIDFNKLKEHDDDVIQEYIHPDLLRFLARQIRILSKDSVKLDNIITGKSSIVFYITLLIKAITNRLRLHR